MILCKSAMKKPQNFIRRIAVFGQKYCKFAVSTKFRKRYRILLDVGGYKEDKYDRIAHIAKRNAKEVQRTKISVQLFV